MESMQIYAGKSIDNCTTDVRKEKRMKNKISNCLGVEIRKIFKIFKNNTEFAAQSVSDLKYSLRKRIGKNTNNIDGTKNAT